MSHTAQRQHNRNNSIIKVNIIELALTHVVGHLGADAEHVEGHDGEEHCAARTRKSKVKKENADKTVSDRSRPLAHFRVPLGQRFQ